MQIESVISACEIHGAVFTVPKVSQVSVGSRGSKAAIILDRPFSGHGFNFMVQLNLKNLGSQVDPV